MIIDAHVHLPVYENCNSLDDKRNTLLEEMKKNNVAKSIVISDSCNNSVIGSMHECVELFESIDHVFVVGGISPFYDFQAQLKNAKDYLDEKKIIGLKLFTGHESFYLTDDSIDEVYQLAMQYKVPVLFHSGWYNEYGDSHLAAEIASKYQDLKLVCCHCFYPEIKKCMSLISYPNIFFDLSAVADRNEGIEEISNIVKELISCAPSRVVFGSDYSGCSESQHIEFIKNLKLKQEIEDNVFWKNAKYLYKI